jgi:hypothetical protein
MNAEAFAPSLDWLRRRVEGHQGDEAMPTPPALATLAEQFGLSSFEQQILLLCVAVEFDPEMAARYQRLHGVGYPTFSLAMRLFTPSSWEALSAAGPLRYWRLIEINQPGALPLTASALRADERIVAYLSGVNALDDRLETLTTPLRGDGNVLSGTQQASVRRLVDAWRRETPRAAQLVGSDPAAIEAAAAAAASESGLRLLRMPAAWLPQEGGEIEQLCRLWARESRLLPLALLIDAHETAPDRMPPVERLSGVPSPIAIATRSARTGPRDTIDIERPTRAEQREAWRSALGGDDEAARRLAAQFNVSLATIAAAAAPRGDHEPAAVWRRCLEHTRPRLEQLATRLVATARWRDLVLPRAEGTLLYGVARQAAQRHVVYDQWGFRSKTSRGLGIAALFAGESGTGKTLAAEVLARHLSLDLYRIDLSAVVSKYIGETEKNLRQVFDAAEDGGALLFFDEADALFGKRTEVKDSHDRYANIEINYLLQRLESFSGVSILATNRKSAIDPAFHRRLRFIVNFPFPDQTGRRRIWEKAMPPQAPVERRHPRLRVDFGALARLNLTGGSIHNIAVNSAFLAATRDRRITWPIVLEAVRGELRKLDRPISEVDRLLPARAEAVPA